MLHDFVKVLGLKEQDALLLFFMFEQKNMARLEEIPAAIEKAATKAAESAKARAESMVSETVAKAAPALTASVSKQVQQIAEASTSVARSKWVMIAAGVCAIAALFLVGGGFLLGQKAGQAQGFAQAQDQKAAASWATTDPGMKAHAMHQSGALDLVTTCSGDGWVKKDGSCYPQPTKDGKIQGWLLP